MQKWVVNGFFGAPIEPIKNRSAVAVWGLGRRFGPNCGLWRSLIEEQEAKLLKEYFTWDEIEAAKEEKEGKIDLIEDDLISDTEEQEAEIYNQDKNQDLIELDKASVSAGEHDAWPDPSLPPNQTQIRASGRNGKAGRMISSNTISNENRHKSNLMIMQSNLIY